MLQKIISDTGVIVGIAIKKHSYLNMLASKKNYGSENVCLDSLSVETVRFDFVKA